MGLNKCIMTHIHHYSIMQSKFTAPQNPLAPSILTSSSQPLATTDFFLLSPWLWQGNLVCCSPWGWKDMDMTERVDNNNFPECHIVGMILCIAFSDWLISLSKMHVSFLHVFSHLIFICFLVLKNIPLHIYSTVYLSIHLMKDILSTPKFWQL